MKTIKQWQFEGCQDNRVIIHCEGSHELNLFVLENNLIRVLIKRKGELRLDRTWSIAPENKDVAFEGRDRMSMEGFSCPAFELNNSDEQVQISTETLRLTIHKPLWLEWEHKQNDQWLPLAADRKTGAYMLGVQDHQVSHFMSRSQEDLYYGLGEKAGDLNRKGKRFEMRNLDAMGYNAECTDPLYKHIPFFITRSNDVSYGLFYDNLATSWFDLGNELDNYHAAYRSYRAEDGDIDYYMMFGPSVAEVTKSYVRMTGGTIFGPKWSLGYSGSTMSYTDAPNAQEQLLQFVELCHKHQIPCDSFQLSSGYTSIGDKRYVFNWNYDKVPSPEKMSADFHEAGMKLAANIKPCLLVDHPKYDDVREQGLFIKDSEFDQPECSMFWDNDGSHLDFTNPDTVQWWKNNVKEQLLEKGIDSTWNDNNEYEIWDANARCQGFGKEIPVRLIRPLMPLLMMRSSYEAQMEFDGEKRPYLISRSGCPGMNRYVQTWTGDNRTNWNSLRYNIRMGLGMSLSGIYNLGHDVGGFAGNRPEPELFARWVQNGVMHPRFTIHSWNDDQTVNEPWMFPEVTPIIRDAITLRYRLMPYLYNLLWQAHKEDEPMLRPTFFDHEHDSNTFEECDDYLLGKDLLVASVVEEGQRKRDVYLPDNTDGWYDFYTNQWFSGGQTITVDAPLEQIPLLTRAGSIIPTSSCINYVDHQADDTRQLLVYPFKGKGQRSISLFDDDGESFGFQKGDFCQLDIDMTCDNETIKLTIKREGSWKPAYNSLKLVLPEGELRKLVVNGNTVANHSEFQLDV